MTEIHTACVEAWVRCNVPSYLFLPGRRILTSSSTRSGLPYVDVVVRCKKPILLSRSYERKARLSTSRVLQYGKVAAENCPFVTSRNLPVRNYFKKRPLNNAPLLVPSPPLVELWLVQQLQAPSAERLCATALLHL